MLQFYWKNDGIVDRFPSLSQDPTHPSSIAPAASGWDGIVPLRQGQECAFLFPRYKENLMELWGEIVSRVSGPEGVLLALLSTLEL